MNASEMLLEVAEAARDGGERIDGVVMMGTGEPLDNFDASVAFIRFAGEENGLCIGARTYRFRQGAVRENRKLQELGWHNAVGVVHAAMTNALEAYAVNRSWGLKSCKNAQSTEGRDGGLYEYGDFRSK
jgi:adenine C2-methylase RlmN of 23S rRNA A2503 and tRNA A37